MQLETTTSYNMQNLQIHNLLTDLGNTMKHNQTTSRMIAVGGMGSHYANKTDVHSSKHIPGSL